MNRLRDLRQGCGRQPECHPHRAQTVEQQGRDLGRQRWQLQRSGED